MSFELGAGAEAKAQDVPIKDVPELPVLPLWPRCWYVVARSKDLSPGAVLSGELAGRPYVLYRADSGRLAALDAHCPHMGTHLRHGKVIGEQLRCPLHHFRLDAAGRCQGGGEGLSSRPWPVAEQFGLVFLYPGEGDAPPLPQPEAAAEASSGFTWTTGKTVQLDTDWRAMMVHGFDLLHLRAVHHREVVELEELGERGGAARLTYVSRVTGRGLSDRLMKALSGDRIRVRQSCHGAIMVVESEVGRQRTAALLGLSVRQGRVWAYGAFGTRGGAMAWPKLWLTRWLFTAFLRRDFAVIEGVKLNLDGSDDAGVRTIAHFLRGLPEMAPPKAGPHG